MVSERLVERIICIFFLCTNFMNSSGVGRTEIGWSSGFRSSHIGLILFRLLT
jgi:hypothetical protein